MITDKVKRSEDIQTAYLQELNLHQKRRDNKLPTLSILVGPLGLGISVWRNWASTNGRAPLFVRFGDNNLKRHIVSKWLHQPYILKRLIQKISPFVHKSYESTLDILKAEPCQERTLLVEQILSGAPTEPIEEVCRFILLDMLCDADRTNADESITYAKLMEGLQQIDGSRGPAFMIFSVKSPEATAKSLTDLIEICPDIVVGWAISAHDYSAFIEKIETSRAKSICQEGTVEIIEPSLDSIRRRFIQCSKGATIQLDESLYRRLVKDGASDELIDMLAEVANASDNAQEGPDEANKARSAAEAFLFNRLESLPETAGLFKLNGKVTAEWGAHGHAEVDLLCRAMSLAIEIDGYYHFCNPDIHRRDRQKDLILQQQGYLVLRFLAEDIVAKLETILDTILTSLSWCDQRQKRGIQNE